MQIWIIRQYCKGDKNLPTFLPLRLLLGVVHAAPRTSARACLQGPLFGMHYGKCLHMQSAAVCLKWPMSPRYPAMSRFVFLSVSNLVRRWCVTEVTRSRWVRHCPGIHSALLTRLPDSAFVPPYFTFGKAIRNEIPLVDFFFLLPPQFSHEKTPAGGNDVISTFHVWLQNSATDVHKSRASSNMVFLSSHTVSFFPAHTDSHSWNKKMSPLKTYLFPLKISDLWPSAVHLQEWLLFVIATPIASPLQAAGENNPPFCAPFNV